MGRPASTLALITGALWAACGTVAPVDEVTLGTGSRMSGLDGSRYVWVDAECADGPLDLAQLGFERELVVELRGANLQLTLDTELLSSGCYHAMVWRAQPALESDIWRIVPEAHVELPAGADCGPQEREPVDGSIRLAGEELEVVTRGSPWCRGFDARFVYRRAAPRRLSERQLVARYVAHFNRRDADELSRLFADNASLVEPFTASDNGNHVRHEGRAEIRVFFERAFATTRWLAMRLSSLSPVDESGTVIAAWQYMDDRLQEPLEGRNLFLAAAGEIYESELQLVSEPKPGTPPPDAPEPGPVDPPQPAPSAASDAPTAAAPMQ